MTGGKVTADDAFPRSRFPFYLKKPLRCDCHDEAEYQQKRKINVAAKSMRQSAEWGMHAFCTSFPRINDRIIYEEIGERELILESFVLLYNLRSQTVGMNQIKSVYVNKLLKYNAAAALNVT
jgi:hypothetical protein